MATGDVTVHVDLDEVLTLLRATLATAQLTDGKVSQLMTDMQDTQSRVAAMAAQIETISARQDTAAGILRDFIATHQDNATVDLTPLTTALGHLEGTTEEVEAAATDAVPPHPDTEPVTGQPPA